MEIYEITAQVRADLVENYETYMLKRHISDVMATGCFAEASFGRSSPGRYRVCYKAFDKNALKEYLASHAAELRKHFADHFPEGIELTRENWDVIEEWQPTSANTE